MPLVINSLGGGHTLMQTHTYTYKRLHKNNFKKSGYGWQNSLQMTMTIYLSRACFRQKMADYWPLYCILHITTTLRTQRVDNQNGCIQINGDSSNALDFRVKSAVLEIAAAHQPFSDQLQHMVNQNIFWLAKFTVHVQREGT